MSFNTKWDPEGKTRRIDQRGFYKKGYFVCFSKGEGKGEEKCNVESRLEALAGMALDLDPDVKEIIVQPFTVDIVNGVILWTAKEFVDYVAINSHRLQPVYYTPDFMVVLMDGRSQVIEAKDLRFLDFSDDYKRKLTAAKELFARQGWGFEFMINQQEANLPWVRNLEYLHQLRLTCPNFDWKPGLKEQLKKYSLELHESGEMKTISEVADHNSTDLRTIAFAVLERIFRVPLWTEYLSPTCLASGVGSGEKNFFSYKQFNAGTEVTL